MRVVIIPNIENIFSGAYIGNIIEAYSREDNVVSALICLMFVPAMEYVLEYK